MRETEKGLESRLLATVRWTVATGVALPQQSESILAHHFVGVRFANSAFRRRRNAPLQTDSSSLIETRVAGLSIRKETACIASFERKSEYGGIAQLGERLNGIQEVSGSIPLISTTFLIDN